eukprot:497743-Hanusia_phi.AAC.1
MGKKISCPAQPPCQQTTSPCNSTWHRCYFINIFLILTLLNISPVQASPMSPCPHTLYFFGEDEFHLDPFLLLPVDPTDFVHASSFLDVDLCPQSLTQLLPEASLIISHLDHPILEHHPSSPPATSSSPSLPD